ncbi:MAG: hypothetical protein GY750_01065 [Lentisphaerae bacterium]|nr:hypothetical protein [Lentisphaerota bacterium]MCP4100008.1 hypothetical protein [Lentisphaerota bacterium]
MEQPDIQQQAEKIFTGVLRSDLKFYPSGQNKQGKKIYRIFDPVSDRYFQISSQDFKVLRALDRSYKLNEFHDKLSRNGISISLKDLLKLVITLKQSGLMLPEPGFTKQLAMRRQQQKAVKTTLLKVLSTWLFFKLPPIRPDAFFTKAAPFVKTIFNRWTLRLLIALSILGYIYLIKDCNQVIGDFIKSISLQGLLRYSIAVVFIKLIHEMGHGFTAKLNGIRVRAAGIAFIVFFPRLFVDVTDSWQLSRRKRLLVDSAGILCEIVIGGIAALIWANSPPGLTHSVTFYIFTVTVINTIMVNGNPFIRYDGYYILSDLTGIEDLMSRAQEYTRRLWRKILFGIHTHGQFPETHGAFMFCFAVSSFIYRIFLFTSIIMIVYFKFTKALGILLLLAEVYVMLLRPLSIEIKTVVKMKSKFKKKNTIMSAAGASILLLLFFIPLPWHVNMPCEIMPEKERKIYVVTSGFIASTLPPDGSKVKARQTILKLRSPQHEILENKLKLEASRCKAGLELSLLDTAGLSAKNVKLAQYKRAVNGLKETREQISQLMSKAPFDGIFVSHKEELIIGRKLNSGTVIGEVYSPGKIYASAFVKADFARDLAPGENITITLSKNMTGSKGTIVSVEPIAAVFRHSPLLKAFGGSIAALPIPGRRELKTNEPYYEVIISVPNTISNEVGRTGTATVVKYSSVGWTVTRKVIKTLLHELSF